MPALIRNIQANVLDNFSSSITILSISGEIGVEDYIKLYSFEAFLQNFTNVIETEVYETPRQFGLLRNKKEDFIELEISY